MSPETATIIVADFGDSVSENGDIATISPVWTVSAFAMKPDSFRAKRHSMTCRGFAVDAQADGYLVTPCYFRREFFGGSVLQLYVYRACNLSLIHI